MYSTQSYIKVWEPTAYQVARQQLKELHKQTIKYLYHLC